MGIVAEARILTREGYKQIIELKDKEVDVWNGYGWSKARVKFEGNKKILRLTISNGAVVNCTEDQKIYYKKNNDYKNVVAIDAKNLKIGMRLQDIYSPSSHSEEVFDIFKNSMKEYRDKYGNQLNVVLIEDNDVYSETYECIEPLENRVLSDGVWLGNNF